MRYSTRHFSHAQEMELVSWLQRHRTMLERDSLTIAEAASRATKALGYRVGNGNMEAAARTVHHTWPKEVKSGREIILNSAVKQDQPSIHVEVISTPPPPEQEEPPVPQPAAVSTPESNEDELIRIMTDFAMLKNRILDQSRKVSEAQRFLKEAETIMKAEQEALNTMMREQLRLRSVIKEAMEI